MKKKSKTVTIALHKLAINHLKLTDLLQTHFNRKEMQPTILLEAATETGQPLPKMVTLQAPRDDSASSDISSPRAGCQARE